MPKNSSYARTLLAGLILLAGCNEEQLTGADTAGSLSFSFDGRTFSAMGRYTGPAGLDEEFAAARRSEDGSALNILAVDVNGQGRTSNFRLSFPATAGAYTCTDASAACAFTGGLDLSERLFVSGTGTLRITEISRDRVKGTFDLANITGRFTNGTFDVPILRGNAQ